MTSTYVAVEGLDGSGKTTVAEALADELDDAVLTQEPVAGTWTGDIVREALQKTTEPATDTFLFMADRAEHLEKVVLPELGKGSTVVSDRSHYSTYAYQYDDLAMTLDRNPWEWLDGVYGAWNTEPDVVIYLDVSVETAIERCGGEEKYEEREFLSRVKGRYDAMMQEGRMGGTCVAVNAEADEESVLEQALDAVRLEAA